MDYEGRTTIVGCWISEALIGFAANTNAQSRISGYVRPNTTNKTNIARLNIVCGYLSSNPKFPLCVCEFTSVAFFFGKKKSRISRPYGAPPHNPYNLNVITDSNSTEVLVIVLCSRDSRGTSIHIIDHYRPLSWAILT